MYFELPWDSATGFRLEGIPDAKTVGRVSQERDRGDAGVLGSLWAGGFKVCEHVDRA